MMCVQCMQRGLVSCVVCYPGTTPGKSAQKGLPSTPGVEKVQDWHITVLQCLLLSAKTKKQQLCSILGEHLRNGCNLASMLQVKARRLKQLHWDKIKTPQQGTIWAKDQPQVNLNLIELENLFQVDFRLHST